MHRKDRAHHHPTIVRVQGRWEWACSCGGHSPRCAPTVRTRPWRDVAGEALVHSSQISA